jgi:hypothetical protein
VRLRSKKKSKNKSLSKIKIKKQEKKMSDDPKVLSNLLLKTQQTCIESLNLNLQLLDEKFRSAIQIAETWKQRHDVLEKRLIEIQTAAPSSQSSIENPN